MFQKFFTNTIQNKFIEAFLRNNPIPFIDTVIDGDLIIANNSDTTSSEKPGAFYIYRESMFVFNY